MENSTKDVLSSLTTTDLGQGEDLADSSPVEEAQMETTENDEVTPEPEEEESGEDTDKKEAVEDKNPPFHKHPRWIEKQEENRRLKEELEALKSSSKNQIGQESEETPSPENGELNQLLQMLPQRKFKSGKPGDDYASYDELYSAVRENLLLDLAEIQTLTEKSAQQAQEERARQITTTLGEIESDLDDSDKFEEFKQYASDVYSKVSPEGAAPDLKMVYAKYLREGYRGQSKESTKKSSKVSKSSKPLSGGGKGLSYGEVSGKSYMDILDEGLNL